MLNYEKIGASLSECLGEIIKPFVCKGGIHRVHYGYLLIHYNI